MKILHILDHSIPLQSGYAFRTRAILREQRGLGWETDHVTSAKHYGSLGREEWVDDLHFFRMPPLPTMITRAPAINQIAVSAQLKRELDPIIERFRPDVLHAHSPALNGLAACSAGRRHGIPVVYEVRAFWEDAAANHGTAREWGARYRLTRALESHVLDRADAVTTICEGLRAEIASRGIPMNKITVIPNSVDAQRFTFNAPVDEQLAHELGLGGKIVLGFVGSFYAYEGLALLVQAFADLVVHWPNLHLLLVGGGPEAEHIRQLVAQLNLCDQISLPGRVPHDRVEAYHSLIDVAVYPRLRMRLTDLVTPLKPLEAMAKGQVVLASDVGGHHELVRDGETGILFRSGSIRALTAAASELLAQRDSWAALRRAGRAFVERERTWRRSVEAYEHVYGTLLQHRTRS